MKPRMSSRAIAVASVILGLCLFAHNNCSHAQFSAVGAAPAGNNSTLSVCNPFGGSSGNPGQGLYANGVFYVDLSQLPSGTTPESVFGNSVEGFFASSSPYISKGNANVYLKDIDFPAEYFSKGFADSDGHTLQDSSGATLTQYFALRFNSVFVPANWAAGDYQIATISDDGSILTMLGAQANGDSFVIKDDGDHSMEMGCTTSVLHVEAGSQIPLQFDYFQGPKITIGLMMLYRPVSVAGNAAEPLCGTGGGNDSYFFLDHDSNNNPISPPKAQSPYLQLTGAFNPSTGSGGWAVVESEHFTLPANTQNSSCQ